MNSEKVSANENAGKSHARAAEASQPWLNVQGSRFSLDWLAEQRPSQPSSQLLSMLQRSFFLSTTDDFSYNVAHHPVHVHDRNATLLHCLDIEQRG